MGCEIKDILVRGTDVNYLGGIGIPFLFVGGKSILLKLKRNATSKSESIAASVNKIFVHGRTLTVTTMEFLLNISWHAYVTERNTESTPISCTKLDYAIV